MNWEAIGAVGEIFGAVAVFLTLFYLARQIGEARRASQAQSVDSIHSSWNREINRWGDSLETASIMGRAVNSYSSLSQAEREVFHVRMHAVLWEHQRQYFYWKNGSWEWDTRDKTELSILSVLVSPGGSEWWSEAKEFYIHRDYFDHMIKERGESIEPCSTKSWLNVGLPPAGSADA